MKRGQVCPHSLFSSFGADSVLSNYLLECYWHALPQCLLFDFWSLRHLQNLWWQLLFSLSFDAELFRGIAT